MTPVKIFTHYILDRRVYNQIKFQFTSHVVSELASQWVSQWADHPAQVGQSAGGPVIQYVGQSTDGSVSQWVS